MIAPADADDLAVGQKAEIRFPELANRGLAPVEGKITRVSAASVVDEKTGTRYFTGEVAVPRAAIDAIRASTPGQTLRNGQPAEVMVTLRRRTLLDYWLEPLLQVFRRSGGEH